MTNTVRQERQQPSAIVQSKPTLEILSPIALGNAAFPMKQRVMSTREVRLQYSTEPSSEDGCGKGRLRLAGSFRTSR